MPSLYLASRGTAHALLARKELQGEMVRHRLAVRCSLVRNETVSGVVSNYLFLNFVIFLFPLGALDLAASRYALYTFVKFRSRPYGGGFVTVNLYLCHKPDFLVHLLYQVRQLNSVNL